MLFQTVDLEEWARNMKSLFDPVFLAPASTTSMWSMSSMGSPWWIFQQTHPLTIEQVVILFYLEFSSFNQS